MPARSYDDLTKLPEGFAYVPDLITEQEETALLRQIGRLEFGPVVFRGVTANRRVMGTSLGDGRPRSRACAVPSQNSGTAMRPGRTARWRGPTAPAAGRRFRCAGGRWLPYLPYLRVNPFRAFPRIPR